MTSALRYLLLLLVLTTSLLSPLAYGQQATARQGGVASPQQPIIRTILGWTLGKTTIASALKQGKARGFSFTPVDGLPADDDPQKRIRSFEVDTRGQNFFGAELEQAELHFFDGYLMNVVLYPKDLMAMKTFSNRLYTRYARLSRNINDELWFMDEASKIRLFYGTSSDDPYFINFIDGALASQADGYIQDARKTKMQARSRQLSPAPQATPAQPLQQESDRMQDSILRLVDRGDIPVSIAQEELPRQLLGGLTLGETTIQQVKAYQQKGVFRLTEVLSPELLPRIQVYRLRPNRSFPTPEYIKLKQIILGFRDNRLAYIALIPKHAEDYSLLDHAIEAKYSHLILKKNDTDQWYSDGRTVINTHFSYQKGRLEHESYIAYIDKRLSIQDN